MSNRKPNIKWVDKDSKFNNKSMKSWLEKNAAEMYFNNIINSKIIVCSCHVTYSFQSESTLYSCLNVKELLARCRREI